MNRITEWEAYKADPMATQPNICYEKWLEMAERREARMAENLKTEAIQPGVI